MERAAIFQIVPELEGFQWMDRYFDTSDADIIAVFDHDTYSIAKHRIALLFTMLWLFVVTFFWIGWIMCCDRIFGNKHRYSRVDSKLGRMLCAVNPVKMFAGSCLMVLLMGSVWIVHITPPHTAVTTEGVIYVDGGSFFAGGGGNKFFFPLHGILDITPSDNDMTIISHVNERSFYREEPSHHAWSSQGASVYTWLPYLKSPQFFQKLVLNLKNKRVEKTCTSMQRDELNFTSTVMEMMTKANADGSKCEPVMETIHDELKRRHDLVAALLANDSN